MAAAGEDVPLGEIPLNVPCRADYVLTFHCLKLLPTLVPDRRVRVSSSARLSYSPIVARHKVDRSTMFIKHLQ